MGRQEALDQYRLALKAGQKCYRDCVHRGRSPYPPVLEDLLRDVMVAGRVDLGVMEIPTELIAGTNTAGRQAAFAANFMPLLEVGSEFAVKWASLCEAPLSDTGITDPIRCFEYMGKFYVQEGNKRVSVLKSFHAPAISAYVTRVLPVCSDEPAVRVYYEFLHFYKLCGLYQVQLTQVGDYPKLQAALGFDADHVWTDREKRAFLSAFYTFQTAYERLAQPEPPVPAAKALLLWLHAYTLGDLRLMTQAELEKSLRAVWPEVLGAARGDQIAMQTDAIPETSGGIFGRYAGRVLQGGVLRIAFVHECAPEQSPWIAAHDRGQQQLAAELGAAIAVRTYLADAFARPENAITQAIEDGAQVVFTTTVPLIFACRRLAAKYPHVRFFNCSVDMPYPGVRTYYGRIYEAKFLMGVLAGILTDEPRIGYIADSPIFGTPASINAFALGARLTRPDAEIVLSWSCCEPEPAGVLRAQGLRVICGRDLPRAGEEQNCRGLCTVADDGSMTCAARPLWDWGNFYVRLVRSILRGGWDELSAVSAGKAVNYWWGFASGAVDIELSQTLPDGPRELLSVLREAMVHGEMMAFHRRIVSQDGTLRNDGGQWLTPEAVLHMDWLCENVRGGIPPYEALLPMARELVRLLGVYRDALQPEKRGPVL